MVNANNIDEEIVLFLIYKWIAKGWFEKNVFISENERSACDCAINYFNTDITTSEKLYEFKKMFEHAWLICADPTQTDIVEREADLRAGLRDFLLPEELR